MTDKRPKSNGEPLPDRSHSSVRRFLLIFLAIVAAYYALTLVPWVDRNILYPVLQSSAQASSFVLNLTGEKTTVKGIVIQGASFAVAVRRGCDPLEPIVLFGAAVIGFPALWRQKITGLALGTALLFNLNVVRIASLYWLGCQKSGWFETVHLELWPAFFILVSLSLWILWLIWIRKTLPRHA